MVTHVYGMDEIRVQFPVGPLLFINMSFSIGIVGLPNVGKSTLFQAITKKQVSRENYPFCTIEPNIGTVTVPDSRLDKLAEFNHSVRKIYTTIEFVDIAGLVRGAHQGEGLGNQFLSHIREVEAIVYVLRAFTNEKIVNSEGDIDILRDKEILDTEMALKDLETIERRMKKLEKEVKAGDKEAIKEVAILKKAAELLAKGITLESQKWSLEEQEKLKKYQFLTLKPRIYLLNGNPEEISKEVLKIFQENKWSFLIMNLLEQFESSELSPEEREELGLPAELQLEMLIKKSYELLDLITFFTINPEETRAWTLKRGTTVPQAGGIIHSDFEKYFIKAEVINWQDLLAAGSFAQAREKGLIRIEGKDYLVADGDVIFIRSG